MADDDKKNQAAQTTADDAEAPQIAAEQQQIPNLGQPALPESTLGTEVAPGQQIPPEKMKEAEHLAQNPKAEEQFRGKQEFHDTMRNFGEQKAALRGGIIGLDASDPQFRQKLSNLTTKEGAIRAAEAHYQQSHPWGSMESAHPGIGGKIGHAFGVMGNIAADALIPGIAPAIPGSQANLAAKARGGAAEEAAGAKQGQEAATTAATEAEVPVREAKTAKVGQEETNLENKPDLANLQQDYEAAVKDAQAHGQDPAKSPKVQQLQDAITSIQRQPTPKEVNAEQHYEQAIQSGDHEGAERWLKIMRDVAAAKQAPQRPPQTMVVLPSGQTEVARPGTVLPPGTQNIGGFATEGRPTTQMRNVSAQAQVAAAGIPPTIAEIQRLQDKLGPLSGRWNDFIQGKVGAEDPDFAGLRADLLMVSSAVALAHARGRLPENLRAEFDRTINAPKQDPKNLISVLQHIQPWLERMGTMGEQPNTVPGQTPQTKPELRPPSPAQPGMKWQHTNPAAGSVQWRQVPQ